MCYREYQSIFINVIRNVKEELHDPQAVWYTPLDITGCELAGVLSPWPDNNSTLLGIEKQDFRSGQE
jgi:hypothetical protein